MEVKKEVVVEKKKRSIAELAAVTTLSEEELEEANRDVDDGDDYEAEDGYDEAYDSEDEEGGREFSFEESEPEEKEEPRMEHYGDIVTLSAHPTEKEVCGFMFRHTYMSVIGFIAIAAALASGVFSVIKFIDGEVFPAALAAASFGLFAIYSPATLLKKSKEQARMLSTEEGTIRYTFSDAGIDLVRGEEYAQYGWERVIKVVPAKTSYYVYLGKNRAFITPQADLGADEECFRKLIVKHVEKRGNIQ
ncbi:MAG: YcxB family protein [Lachnospiraceae bacterium]|nr:YcxB family protein [Lachnospiraceae bacterium]